MIDNSPTPSPTPNPRESLETEYREKLEAIKKYGYYYDILGPEERKHYLLAQTDPGLEAYIDVFRKTIERAVPISPNGVKLINDSLKTLKRMEALNVKIRREYPLPQRPTGQPGS